MMRISIVLPIYLNRPHLPELYRRLTSTLSASADRYEIIFVDDKGPTILSSGCGSAAIATIA